MEDKFKVVLTVGLILRRENKVLLIKRKNTGYMDGMYGFLGGHVEQSESLKQAMVREAYEEGRVLVKEEDLDFVCGIRNGNNMNYINYFFTTDKFDGEPVINEPDKCEEIVWKDIDDIPESTITNEKRAIYNYLNNIYLDEYNF